MSDRVLRQLYIMRIAVEAAIEELEGATPLPVPGTCPHPEDKRYDATTAGDGPHKWICGECLQEFEGMLP